MTVKAELLERLRAMPATAPVVVRSPSCAPLEDIEADPRAEWFEYKRRCLRCRDCRWRDVLLCRRAPATGTRKRSDYLRLGRRAAVGAHQRAPGLHANPPGEHCANRRQPQLCLRGPEHGARGGAAGAAREPTPRAARHRRGAVDAGHAPDARQRPVGRVQLPAAARGAAASPWQRRDVRTALLAARAALPRGRRR